MCQCCICQVIADVFNTSVYVTDVPNSASLGGCYRAIYGRSPILHCITTIIIFISSPEHEVLMVSYCGQWLSVVRRRPSCVVRRPSCVNI